MLNVWWNTIARHGESAKSARPDRSRRCDGTLLRLPLAKSDEAEIGHSTGFDSLRMPALRHEQTSAVRGDCEDYAILKYAALLEAGIPEDDVKIVILKNFLPREEHAAVATRVDGQWLILDNRTLTLVRDTDVTRAIPEFVLDHEGVKRFNWASRIRRTGS